MPLHKQHRELVDHIRHRYKKGESLTFIHASLVRAGYDDNIVSTALHDYALGFNRENEYVKVIDNALSAKKHLYVELDTFLSKDFKKVQEAVYALSTSRRSSLYNYLVHMRVHFYFQIACVVVLFLMSILFSPWFLIPLAVIGLEFFVLHRRFRKHRFYDLDWYPFRTFKIFMGSLFYEHLGAAGQRRYLIGPHGGLLLLLSAMGVFFGVSGSVYLAILSIFTGLLCYVSFNDHIF